MLLLRSPTFVIVHRLSPWYCHRLGAARTCLRNRSNRLTQPGPRCACSLAERVYFAADGAMDGAEPRAAGVVYRDQKTGRQVVDPPKEGFWPIGGLFGEVVGGL